MPHLSSPIRPKVKPEQIVAALVKLGFHAVREVLSAPMPWP
jgi:predicted RNA binding protein YcfA (HicA-like mRNA interferase family)